MQIDEFRRLLKQYDRHLDVRWVPSAQRFGIWRLFGGNTHDPKGLGDVKTHRLVFKGFIDNTRLFDIVPDGVFIGYIQSVEGGYAPLGRHVLALLRNMDMWQRDIQAKDMERAAVEAEEKKNRMNETYAEEYTKDVVQTVQGLAHPKVFHQGVELT